MSLSLGNDNMKQNNQSVTRQKVIYLHDSTCKGLHQFVGGGWDKEGYYGYVRFACWDCGKPLGTLYTHQITKRRTSA